jgi:hypothetical protein
MSRQSALWILAGVLGIVLAAAITWATSQLAGQHIGLSSEPISAARALAPRSPERATSGRVRTTIPSRAHSGRAPAVPQANSTASEAASTVEAAPAPATVEQPPSAAGEPSAGSGAASSSGEARTRARKGGDDGAERRSAHGRDD